MKSPSTIRWLSAIAAVDREQWDRLAVPLSTPLLEWQWLHELEASGSIAPRHGWQPRHLTVWRGPELVGAAPLYVKTHSDGEFVFDHWWAQLAAQYGAAYYPKMVGMSPATPAVGYRFLMAEDVDQPDLMRLMLAAIDRFCQEQRLSCCHLNFVDQPWFARLPSAGFLGWRHQSYLWTNPGFRTFEDYLGQFTSTQRHNIRRECRRMERYGIDIRALTGDEIPAELGPLMYRYYLNTNASYGRWAARFLNGDFFARIFRTFRQRLLVFAAYADPAAEPLALSMLLVKDRQLIGRYWGCAEPIRDLHFNMCFYAPIRWAIEHDIRTFDPGAGSPHKIYRGFAAVANSSLHRFYDPRLKVLFAQLIDEVNNLEQANIDNLNRQLPFVRRAGGQPA